MQRKKYTSVDQFIKDFPPETQKILQKVRETIKKLAPKAEESISYNIPFYKFEGGRLIYFAGYAKHISIYPFPSGYPEFQEEVKSFKTSKGTIQFPLDKPIPYDVIKKIVKFRMQLLKEAKKGKSY